MTKEYNVKNNNGIDNNTNSTAYGERGLFESDVES